MTDDINEQAPDCPNCHSSANVVAVIYGLPGPEGFELVKRGERVLGSCVLSPDVPTPMWACKACHQRFGSHHNLFERLFPNASARQQAEEHQL